MFIIKPSLLYEIRFENSSLPDSANIHEQRLNVLDNN